MMPDKDYVLEKLAVAADCLASGTGSIQDRLTIAATSALIRLEPEDFSLETRDDFDWIITALTNVEPIGEEGQFAASAGAMTAESARDVASKIIWLMYAVATDDESS
jgi:hypothetical protein